jgi:hypothetical protein
MRRYRSVAALAAAILLGAAEKARAGMPSTTLSELAQMRFQAISFFLACFLLCSWIVQRIWNSLRTDLPWLPRLSYKKAVGLVSLWGLLFLLVLTMISGARELLTPGAWHKEGFTYKLGPSPSEDARPEPGADRKHGLDGLRVVLWHYARQHGGKFPSDARVPEIPEDVWKVPDGAGMTYIYEGGQSADQGDMPLAFEPGIFADRLVLLTNGEIRRLTPGDLRRLTPEGRR